MPPETRTFPNIPKLVEEVYGATCSTPVSLATALPGCTHAIVQAIGGPMRITIAGATPALGSGEDDTAAVGLYIPKSSFAPDVIRIDEAKVIGTAYSAWGYAQP